MAGVVDIVYPVCCRTDMLCKNEVYNYELYKKADKLPATRELTTAQAVAFLRSKGILIVYDDIGEAALFLYNSF